MNGIGELLHGMDNLIASETMPTLSSTRKWWNGLSSNAKRDELRLMSSTVSSETDCFDGKPKQFDAYCSEQKQDIMYYMDASATKSKSIEEFIRSQYYAGFTKFGRSCVLNEYLQPEKFAEWLIKEGKKLADWSKDSVYDEFLLQYVKKEPGLKALERNVIYLSEWSKENECDWQDYFRFVSTSRAVHDLRSAKISPWLLYLSETGDELLTRLNDEQVGMVCCCKLI